MVKSSSSIILLMLIRNVTKTIKNIKIKLFVIYYNEFTEHRMLHKATELFNAYF